MKVLTLIRHGKSDWKAGLSDHARPLNSRGRQDADKTGLILSQERSIDLFFISSAHRTTETFNRMNTYIKANDGQQIICPELYLCTDETLMDTIHCAPDEQDSIAIIGHNPGLSHLASHFSHQSYIDMPTLAVYRCVFDTDKWEDVSIDNMISYHFVSPKTVGK